jgi:hypothetical protein
MADSWRGSSELGKRFYLLRTPTGLIQMHTYKLGDYIREEYFHELVQSEGSALLVHCHSPVTKNKANKFSGRWHLYVYSTENETWHPLVKSKLENRRIVKRSFFTSDGLINSLLRFNYPVVGISSERDSGCEIHKDGGLYYRANCMFE